MTPPPSAQVAPPSAQVALPPSAQVAPEPVRTEPVKEPKQQQRAREATKAIKATNEPGRNSCPKCGNTWPASFGPNCHKCPPKPQRTQEPEITPEPAQTDPELPSSIFARAGRFNCRVCGNTWPESFGTVCRTCSSIVHGSMKAVMWQKRRRDSDVRSEAIDRERRARKATTMKTPKHRSRPTNEPSRC